MWIAQAFLENIYKLHGPPNVIVSHRDKAFTSHFWQKLLKLTDAQLNMSGARHPETDGHTLRSNQCSEKLLKMFCACFFPTSGITGCPSLKFTYNSAYHLALNTTPFRVYMAWIQSSWMFRLFFLHLFQKLMSGYNNMLI